MDPPARRTALRSAWVRSERRPRAVLQDRLEQLRRHGRLEVDSDEEYGGLVPRALERQLRKKREEKRMERHARSGSHLLWSSCGQRAEALISVPYRWYKRLFRMIKI